MEEPENLAGLINQNKAIAATEKGSYAKAQALALLSIAQTLIEISRVLVALNKKEKK